jgi:hypothetical protein
MPSAEQTPDRHCDALVHASLFVRPHVPSEPHTPLMQRAGLVEHAPWPWA